MIRAIVIIVLCFPAFVQASEWIDVTVMTANEATQAVTQATNPVIEVSPQIPDPCTGIGPWLIGMERPVKTTINGLCADVGEWGLGLENPDMTTINGILEDLQKLTIQAGSDFSLPMQWRIAEIPEPFPGGQWPTAELRSAKSPAGVVLATYTVTIVDGPLVKWSLDLSAAQTAALSGKKGYTEMKIPYDVGVYHMYVRIPTEVLPRVSQ